MKSKRLPWLFLFLLVLLAEIVIALWVRDRIFRPFVGDLLVTLGICFFVRALYPKKLPFLPLYVFLFASLVEIGQYFDLVSLLGLDDVTWISVLFGRTFSVADLFSILEARFY